MVFSLLESLSVYFGGAVDKKRAQIKLDQIFEGVEIENLKEIPQVEEKNGHLVAEFSGYSLREDRDTRALLNAIEKIEDSFQKIGERFDENNNKLTRIPKWQYVELSAPSQEQRILLMRNAPSSNEPG